MKRYFFTIILILLTGCASPGANYNNKGNEEFSKENFDNAEQEYKAAKEADPNLAEPYYNLANLFHIQGDLKSAVAQAQQAIRLAGENDKLAQKSFFNMGNSHFLAEDFGAAVKAYQEALLLDPNDLDAKHNLELILQNAQRKQQGQQQGGQQKQDNPGQQPGDSDKSKPQDQKGDKPNPSGSGEEKKDEKDEKADKGSAPDEQKKSGEELTQEEAERLLDNLSQNSQTLQERLNQAFDGKNRRRPPSQDW